MIIASSENKPLVVIFGRCWAARISQGGGEGWVPKDKLKKTNHPLLSNPGGNAEEDGGYQGSELWDLREHHCKSAEVFQLLNGEPEGMLDR